MSKVRKTAFISGSGRNIGRAIALRLAADGFNIVLNGSRDRTACEVVAADVVALGAGCLVAMGDVADSGAVGEMAKTALAEFGRVDAVIHNAAIRPQKNFLEMTDGDWDRVIGLDLNAAFYLARAFLPGMVEGGWGRIVNMAGMHAIHGYSGRAPVSAAKHGLWGLCKSLAKEFGPHGVTANVISPGPILPDDEESDKAHYIREQLPNIPVGRLGKTDDIAEMTAFLCSDQAGFVSGQMIVVNGATET